MPILLINILKLKDTYPESIKIKGNPTINAIARKFIYDSMAIDGKKLMIVGKQDDKTDLPKKDEMYHISTIYLQKESIEYLKLGFENIWNMLR